jgi:hypothetical protein
MVVQKNPESAVNNFPLREETTDGTIAAAKNWWINALPSRNCKDRVSIHQQQVFAVANSALPLRKGHNRNDEKAYH